MKIIKVIGLFLILVLPVQLLANSMSLLQQRERFSQAEKSLKVGKSSKFLKQANAIKDYPLYPYLQYQWLQKNLNETKKVEVFLKSYGDTRYGNMLGKKWQLRLASQQRWTAFMRHYKPTKDAKLQCHFFWGKYKLGDKTEALLGAKKLWVVGRSQPSACDNLFKALKKSKYFTNELVWQRFSAALENKKDKLAKYIKNSMSSKDRKSASLWLKVHANPMMVRDVKKVKQQNPQSGLIFSHGVMRLIRKDYDKAIEVWNARKAVFNIDEVTANKVKSKLGMKLALNRDPRAYDYLDRATKLDEKAQEWRVRAALRNFNWQGVIKSIGQLSQALQASEKWQYWKARALDETQHGVPAHIIFTKLSVNRSFYGYLSADKLKTKYQLADRPVVVSKEMLDKLKQTSDFRVFSELLAVDKEREARQQWWYSVKKLSKADILIASKYAEELGWRQISIFTIAKAKYWDDVSLRFPVDYEDAVYKNALRQKLSPAVIFGLIRRESVFSKNAQSHVGARGLMQIMPATGRQIAKQFKEKLRNKNRLLNPSLNIRYGTFYYKQLLNQFNGHYALAAAAYNAGPHRVNHWLPEAGWLPADIWVETIPFNETRGYVAAVMTYSLIYQQLINKGGLAMADLMHDVSHQY